MLTFHQVHSNRQARPPSTHDKSAGEADHHAVFGGAPAVGRAAPGGRGELLHVRGARHLLQPQLGRPEH